MSCSYSSPTSQVNPCSITSHEGVTECIGNFIGLHPCCQKGRFSQNGCHELPIDSWFTSELGITLAASMTSLNLDTNSLKIMEVKFRGCERVDILKRDNAKYLRLPKAGQKRTAHPSGTQTEHKTAHEIRCLVMKRLDYKRAYSTSGLYTTLPSISSPIQSEGSTSKLYTNGR